MKARPAARRALTLCSLAGMAVVLAVGAATASAQAPAKPEPGCAGIQLVDKKGDSQLKSTDILDVWFDHVGGKTFAHMRINDLKLEFAQDSTHLYWYVTYAVSPDIFRVFAHVRRDGAKTFGWRRFVDTPDPPAGPTGAYGPPQSTPGTIFEGPDGVIQWEMPEGAGGAVGKVFTDTSAAAD